MARIGFAMARVADALRLSALLHVILPTIVAMLIVVGATAIYLPGITDAATIESARHGNVEIADLIKTTRGYYTRQMVAKALNTGGMTPAYNHATFVKDISDILQKKDVMLSLISPYPWPPRAERKMDAFQTTAWEAFQRDPEAVISRQEQVAGRRVLRVAVADRMTGPTCVSCHNSDPLSGKQDWKVGDVRAVMEVTKVVEPHLAAAERRSRFIVLSARSGLLSLR